MKCLPCRVLVVTLSLLAVAFAAPVSAEEHVVLDFQSQRLTDVYYSEGVAAGDLNGDGHFDIVYGPYWFAGPDFKHKHEIYPAKPQPRERYADNFFAWIYDFNGDGWNDVLVVGFPGTPAYVYENPTGGQLDRLWTRHEIFDWVSNESPHFTNVVGNKQPELVCTRDGRFGFVTFDVKHPFQPWTFHAISDDIAPKRFGHGLGVGDVNGDGRMDILHAGGWFEQPETDAGTSLWQKHDVSFSTAYGGAEMFAYDVDGDGDNDVITSLAAHDFGLAWYEQVHEGGGVAFHQRLIMGHERGHNPYGVLFSELHSVSVADIDGDGLKDIVTGKTYYSHHQQSPMWDAGAVVYWFKLVRGLHGVEWIPYPIDGEAGIGRQVRVHDVNGDGLPDVVTGGMLGAHVLTQQRRRVDEATWQAAQPKRYVPPPKLTENNPPAPIDAATGKVPGALEGESVKVLSAGSGQATAQTMGNFKKGTWSGNAQLFWRGARPGERLELELPKQAAGKYVLKLGLTMARDYGIVQMRLNGQPLGPPVDLYNFPDVVTTGVMDLGRHELPAGKPVLSFEITGANPAAVKGYMVGVDWVALEGD